MERKVADTEAELSGLLKEGSDGAGRDPADVGSSNFERDQELSLANNSREMLNQLRLALTLFDRGEYGLCEVCGPVLGEPVGRIPERGDAERHGEQPGATQLADPRGLSTASRVVVAGRVVLAGVLSRLAGLHP